MCSSDLSSQFAQVLNDHRLLSEIAFVRCSASGVQTATEQMAAVLGVTVLDDVPPTAAEGYPLLIISGQWTPEIHAAYKGRLGWWWHSHMAQMDSNRHEVADLLKVLDAVGGSAERFCLFTAQPEADALCNQYGGRVRWLPNVRRMPEHPQNHVKLDGRHVFIPGPYVARKNCYAAMLAIKIAGAEAHVTARAEAQAPSLLALGKAIGVKVHIHGCNTAEDVLMVAGSCHAAVMASMAETFCHAAAESILAGTPVVASAAVPAARDMAEHSELCVHDPTNVAELARCLTHALERPKELLDEQFRALQALVAVHVKAARKTLLEVAYA